MDGTNKPMGETADGVLAPIVSHGRGGQGNIRPDDTPYVDAAITRQGVEGDQGDGAYSAGRGGAGNIGAAGTRPKSTTPHDIDVIPALAVRSSMEGNYHVGRGGQGNVSHEADRRAAGPGEECAKVEEEMRNDRRGGDDDEFVGLADKLKYKIFGRK